MAMAERVILTIGRNGIISERIEPYSDPATTKERFEALREAVIRDYGEGTITMALRCDRCLRVQRVEKPELPEGWRTTASGDFCPACR